MDAVSGHSGSTPANCEEEAMSGPSVEIKSGGYTIPALKSMEFTFWWGDGAVPLEYFDVSIEPNPTNPNMTPLIEEKREITLFNGAPRQPMLILTLRNNNNVPIDFFANHIRVYTPLPGGI
jgi:hypothetical protein